MMGAQSDSQMPSFSNRAARLAWADSSTCVSGKPQPDECLLMMDENCGIGLGMPFYFW